MTDRHTAVDPTTRMNPVRPRQAPREILTLPPLEELRQEKPVSQRTGEPPRPWPIIVGHVLLQMAIVGVAIAYGWHFYRAVTPQTYPISSHLVQWTTPPAGEWLSLTLEGVLAALAALTGGICGVAGFQAWNGWRWSRAAGVTAVALTGIYTALMNYYGLIAVGFAVVGAALLFLPAATDYFDQWTRRRAPEGMGYRRPQHVYYGRLAQFR